MFFFRLWFRLFSFPQTNYQQTVVKVMFDARAVNRSGKRQSFLETTVSDFHLLKSHPDGARFVAPTARDVQLIALNVNFDFFRRNAR